MTSSQADAISIRPAHVSDVPEIQALIVPYVERRVLLPRSVEELRDLTRNGFVAESASGLVGFAAVDIYSRKLAELQCLAVADAYQSSGIGRRLVEACVECARQHDVQELMAITAAEEFFRGCGFHFSLPDQKKALFVQTRMRR
jgi:amino-acid N-acetyltransferase